MANTDADRLLRALEGTPDGLAIRPLMKSAGLSRTSVQKVRRLLAELERQGMLHTTGRTRARRYLAGPAPAVVSATGLGLSREGTALRERLRRPTAARTPVSYQRAFLDSYVPNQSWYLPASLRARLQALGFTDAEGQPAGTWARRVLERLLIDLSWNSSRLEGNTYSLLDTEKLLARGEAAAGHDRLETQMLLNHKAAIEFLVGDPVPPALDATTLKNLHALLTDNLLAGPEDAGRIRRAPVAITESVYLPLANPQLLEECFTQLVATAQRIGDPFEQSFFLLVHLSYLQPFIDGNKRTARLAANLPFVHHNLVPLSFVDVDREAYTLGVLGVYEENRVELLRDVFAFAYERSSARLKAVRQSLGEPDPFRLAWRTQLKQAVGDVVRGALARDAAQDFLARFADEQLPVDVRARFQASALAELDALHDGNFARYAVRPSEFQAWAARWRA